MIERELYLKMLDDLNGKHIIKVVSGVRRCGKSTLLLQFQERLEQNGVEKKRIISLNFEDSANEWLLDRRKLHKFITDQVADKKTHYVFLDEIQNVPDFEKMIDSLYTRPNIDIYITGSNAYLLSGELATFLSGRYIEISILPYSFAEYMSQYPKTSAREKFDDFVEYGAFPQAVDLSDAAKKQVRPYLKAVYESVVTKDILTRLKVKKEQSFENVAKFLFSNVGSPTSINNIVNTLKNENKTVDFSSVDRYISALADSFIFYKADRYDIKGKKILKTQDKFYSVDTGLRQAVTGATVGTDLGHQLENVVYLELLRRNSKVFIGKAGDNEVDFVAQDFEGHIVYYQVALSTRSANVLKRELKPLLSLNDHYQKILLTLDSEEPVHNGIQQKYIVKWLLDNVR